MIRVVIESPLNAPTREGIERNKKYARAALLDSLRRGEAPYASHLLYDHPEILDDLSSEERELGIQAGFAWCACAQKIAVYADFGISSGMRRGIDLHSENGVPVEYRYLYPRGDIVK